MCLEVRRVLGRRPVGKVSGRRHHHPWIVADVAAAHRRIGQPAHSQREIDTVGYQVEVAVLAGEVDLQMRLLPHEIHQQRGQDPAPERHRGRNPQRAGQGLAALADRGIRIIDFGDDAGAAFVVGQPIFGEAYPAGVAIEQPRPEVLFELRDGLGNARLRDRELVGCLGKAPELDHPFENANAGKMVHGSKRNNQMPPLK